MTDQEDREKIEASLPAGWESRHIRLTYDVSEPINAVFSRTWGVCGHGLVCLDPGLASQTVWLHPYPHDRFCDDPPAMRHIGIIGRGQAS